MQARGGRLATLRAAHPLEPWPRIRWGLEVDPSKVPFTGPKALEVSVRRTSFCRRHVCPSLRIGHTGRAWGAVSRVVLLPVRCWCMPPDAPTQIINVVPHEEQVRRRTETTDSRVGSWSYRVVATTMHDRPTNGRGVTSR